MAGNGKGAKGAFMDAVACLVALVRHSAAHQSAVVHLYRTQPDLFPVGKGTGFYTVKQVERIRLMAERWGEDDKASVAWVHQQFPPAAYPSKGPDAAKFPPIGNLMQLWQGAIAKGILAPNAPGWVDACKLAVAQEAIEQEKAGFKTFGGKFVPSYKLAVAEDIAAIRKRLEGVKPAETVKTPAVPENLAALLKS